MTCEKNEKRPYICGPWTELDRNMRDQIKAFYLKLAEICQEILQIRGRTPCEMYDTVKMNNSNLKTLFYDQREIVTTKTSVLIVCVLEQIWSGGVEIAWANEYSIPIIVLIRGGCRPSPLFIGGPAMFDILHYEKEEQALFLLKTSLLELDDYYTKHNRPFDQDCPPIKSMQANSVIKNIQKDIKQLNIMVDDPLNVFQLEQKE